MANNWMDGYDDWENGKNVLYGGAGNDILVAGDNNNYLTGDSGNDTIYGKGGLKKAA